MSEVHFHKPKVCAPKCHSRLPCPSCSPGEVVLDLPCGSVAPATCEQPLPGKLPDSTALERGTKSLLGRMATHLPSLQTVDTLSVGVGWQIQLVLLFQGRWHKTTSQVVVAAGELGGRFFGCCQGDEQVWLEPSRVSLLHIPS